MPHWCLVMKVLAWNQVSNRDSTSNTRTQSISTTCKTLNLIIYTQMKIKTSDTLFQQPHAYHTHIENVHFNLVVKTTQTPMPIVSM